MEYSKTGALVVALYCRREFLSTYRQSNRQAFGGPGGGAPNADAPCSLEEKRLKITGVWRNEIAEVFAILGEGGELQEEVFSQSTVAPKSITAPVCRAHGACRRDLYWTGASSALVDHAPPMCSRCATRITRSALRLARSHRVMPQAAPG